LCIGIRIRIINAQEILKKDPLHNYMQRVEKKNSGKIIREKTQEKKKTQREVNSQSDWAQRKS
jgi:hypothetical protein